MTQDSLRGRTIRSWNGEPSTPTPLPAETPFSIGPTSTDGLRARIRQVVAQFGGGAISDEDADAAAGVLYGTPLAASPGAFEWDDCQDAYSAGYEAGRAEGAGLDLRIEQERRSAFLAAQEAVRLLSPRSKAIGTIGHMIARADAAIARLATPAPEEAPE